jgi:FkbM family methyltransferase
MSKLLDYLVPRIKLAFGRSVAALTTAAYRKRYDLSQLVRIGTDYGGWYCDRRLLGAGRTAVCCGAGEDISFDVALNGSWQMRVVCVDPTPRAIRHVEALLAAHRERRRMLIEAGPLYYDLSGFRPAAFDLVECAVWSTDGVLELYAPQNPAFVSYSALNLQRTSERIQVPARTLESLVRDRGITHVSLLKLDIEGAEHEVLRSMLRSHIRPDQVLVEFDQINQPLGPLFWIELIQTIRQLGTAGYDLVLREHSNFVFVRRSAQLS